MSNNKIFLGIILLNIAMVILVALILLPEYSSDSETTRMNGLEMTHTFEQKKEGEVMVQSTLKPFSILGFKKMNIYYEKIEFKAVTSPEGKDLKIKIRSEELKKGPFADKTISVYTEPVKSIEMDSATVYFQLEGRAYEGMVEISVENSEFRKVFTGKVEGGMIYLVGDEVVKIER